MNDLKTFGKNQCQSKDEEICFPLCIAKFFNIKLEELWNREQINNNIIDNGVLEINNIINLVQKKFPNYTFLIIPRQWIKDKNKDEIFAFSPTQTIEMIYIMKPKQNFKKYHAVYATIIPGIKNDIIEDPYENVCDKIDENDVISYCFFICNSYKPTETWCEKIKRILHIS